MDASRERVAIAEDSVHLDFESCNILTDEYTPIPSMIGMLIKCASFFQAKALEYARVMDIKNMAHARHLFSIPIILPFRMLDKQVIMLYLNGFMKAGLFLGKKGTLFEHRGAHAQVVVKLMINIFFIQVLLLLTDDTTNFLGLVIDQDGFPFLFVRQRYYHYRFYHMALVGTELV